MSIIRERERESERAGCNTLIEFYFNVGGYLCLSPADPWISMMFRIVALKRNHYMMCTALAVVNISAT